MANNETLTMRMLKKTAAQIGPDKLKDVVVLHINHCMDNSFYFNDVLTEVFGKTIFIGVPYNNKTMDGVKADYDFYTAYSGHDYFMLFRNNETIERHFVDHNRHKSVGALTRMLIKAAITIDVIPELEKGKKFLVIEDGGEHFEVVDRLMKEYPILEQNFIGSVEQTTSGTRKYLDAAEKYGAKFPCASVARSRIKMSLEAVFIGQRVVEELSSFMYTANSFLNYQNVLILGYGIVGRTIGLSLAPYSCHVLAYDRDPELMKTVEADCIQPVYEFTPETFENDTVIIGSVGLASFEIDMLHQFMKSSSNNLYLASASSKNIEFINFIEAVEQGGRNIGMDIKLVEKSKLYSKYEVRYPDDAAKAKDSSLNADDSYKNVFLFAEGVPVNFYKEDSISLTYRLIDIIFTEMLLLGEALFDMELENKLYLLGSGDEVDKRIVEPKLIRDWFDINKLYTEGQIVRGLRVHPKVTYLRSKLIK